MRIAHSGRARISIRRPRGLAESDRSGFWYNHADMRRQFEYAGNKLVDTGLLVGPDELDIPQDQYRSPILPPDPLPLVNPRPSANVTGIPIIGQPLPPMPGNLGFSSYNLGSAAFAGGYPTTKTAVLSQVVTASGIPTPGGIVDRSITIGAVNSPLSLMAANPARAWLLLYNPAVPLVLASEGTAVWGAQGQLPFGPGQAFFWSTSQLLGTVYRGALTVIAQTPMQPFFAWEA